MPVFDPKRYNLMKDLDNWELVVVPGEPEVVADVDYKEVDECRSCETTSLTQCVE